MHTMVGRAIYVGVQTALGVEKLFYQLNLEGKALAQLHTPSCYRKCESISIIWIDWETFLHKVEFSKLGLLWGSEG